jgi:hypothetical protein
LSAGLPLAPPGSPGRFPDGGGAVSDTFSAFRNDSPLLRWWINLDMSWESHGNSMIFTKKIKKNDRITLWLFNIAMENGPFTDDFPVRYVK